MLNDDRAVFDRQSCCYLQLDVSVQYFFECAHSLTSETLSGDRAIRHRSKCTNCEISNIECVAAGSQVPSALALLFFLNITLAFSEIPPAKTARVRLNVHTISRVAYTLSLSYIRILETRIKRLENYIQAVNYTYAIIWLLA